VVGRFIDGLDTPVMQDWGGPIGLAAALDRQDRVKAMIIGNTWAWTRTDNVTQRFSSALGEGRTSEFLVDRANVFVNLFVRRAMRRPAPSGREMAMWRGPFPDQDPGFRRVEKRRWESILTNRTGYDLRHAGHYWQDDAGPEAALMIRYWWDQAGLG